MFDALKRIDMLRTERGWSFYKLAKEASIPQSSLTTWFSRDITPPLEAIEKICDALEISMAEFFNYTEYIDSPSKLAMRRKQSGITQEELAKKIGISKDTLCAYEQKKRDIVHAQYWIVYELAKALDCDTEDIVDFK